MRNPSPPSLSLSLVGTPGIVDTFQVDVVVGSARETVDEVRIGNFDSMPHEPTQREWSFVLELHHAEPNLILHVRELERINTIVNGQYTEQLIPSTRTFARTVSRKWTKVRQDERWLDDTWTEALSTLGEQTLLERVEQGPRNHGM